MYDFLNCDITESYWHLALNPDWWNIAAHLQCIILKQTQKFFVDQLDFWTKQLDHLTARWERKQSIRVRQSFSNFIWSFMSFFLSQKAQSLRIDHLESGLDLTWWKLAAALRRTQTSGSLQRLEKEGYSSDRKWAVSAKTTIACMERRGSDPTT